MPLPAPLRPQIGGPALSLLIEAVDCNGARVPVPAAAADALAKAELRVAGAGDGTGAAAADTEAVKASFELSPAGQDRAIAAAVALTSGRAQDGAGAAGGLRLQLAWDAGERSATDLPDGLTVSVEWPCAAILPGPIAASGGVRLVVTPVVTASSSHRGAEPLAEQQGRVTLRQMQRFSASLVLSDAFGNVLFDDAVAAAGLSLRLVASAQPPWLLTDAGSAAAAGGGDEIEIIAGTLVMGLTELVSRAKPLRVQPYAALGAGGYALTAHVRGRGGAEWTDSVAVEVATGAFPRRAAFEDSAPLVVPTGKAVRLGTLLLFAEQGAAAGALPGPGSPDGPAGLPRPDIHGCSRMTLSVWAAGADGAPSDPSPRAKRDFPADSKRWKPHASLPAFAFSLPEIRNVSSSLRAGSFLVRLSVSRPDPLEDVVAERRLVVAPARENPRVEFAEAPPPSLARPGPGEPLFPELRVSFTDCTAARNRLGLRLRPAPPTTAVAAVPPEEMDDGASLLGPEGTGAVEARLQAERVGSPNPLDPQRDISVVDLLFDAAPDGDGEQGEDAMEVDGGGEGAWPAGQLLRDVRVPGEGVMPLGRWRLVLTVTSREWARAGGAPAARSTAFVCRANALNPRDRRRLEALERELEEARLAAQARQEAVVAAHAARQEKWDDLTRTEEAIGAAERDIQQAQARQARAAEACLPRLLEPLPALFGASPNQSLGAAYEAAPHLPHPHAPPGAPGARNRLFEERAQPAMRQMVRNKKKAPAVLGLLCEQFRVRPTRLLLLPWARAASHAHISRSARKI